MDILESLRFRIGHHPFLKRFNAFTEHFEHGKILVDHGIDQCIDEIVRAILPQSPLTAFQAIPNSPEHIRPVLLKREHIIPPKNKTDLLNQNISAIGGRQHLHHKK